MLNQMIKKLVNNDATNLWGRRMIQSLLYDEPKLDKDIILKAILNTKDNSYIDCMLEIDLK